MSFEQWWHEQKGLTGDRDYLEALRGWDHAYIHTSGLLSIHQHPKMYHYRSSEPFSVGHNAAVVEILADMARWEL